MAQGAWWAPRAVSEPTGVLLLGDSGHDGSWSTSTSVVEGLALCKPRIASLPQPPPTPADGIYGGIF